MDPKLVDMYLSRNEKVTVGIEKSCYETEPCMHTVWVDGRSVGLMMGTEIVALFRVHEIPIPEHFQSYDDPRKYSSGEIFPLVQ